MTTPHQARVLGLVVQGYRTAAELAKKLGVKRQVTQKTLGKLRAKGLVEQVDGARSKWRPILSSPATLPELIQFQTVDEPWIWADGSRGPRNLLGALQADEQQDPLPGPPTNIYGEPVDETPEAFNARWAKEFDLAREKLVASRDKEKGATA